MLRQRRVGRHGAHVRVPAMVATRYFTRELMALAENKRHRHVFVDLHHTGRTSQKGGPGVLVRLAVVKQIGAADEHEFAVSSHKAAKVDDRFKVVLAHRLKARVGRHHLDEGIVRAHGHNRGALRHARQHDAVPVALGPLDVLRQRLVQIADQVLRPPARIARCGRHPRHLLTSAEGERDGRAFRQRSAEGVAIRSDRPRVLGRVAGTPQVGAAHEQDLVREADDDAEQNLAQDAKGVPVMVQLRVRHVHVAERARGLRGAMRQHAGARRDHGLGAIPLAARTLHVLRLDAVARPDGEVRVPALVAHSGNVAREPAPLAQVERNRRVLVWSDASAIQELRRDPAVLVVLTVEQKIGAANECTVAVLRDDVAEIDAVLALGRMGAEHIGVGRVDLPERVAGPGRDLGGARRGGNGRRPRGHDARRRDRSSGIKGGGTRSTRFTGSDGGSRLGHARARVLLTGRHGRGRLWSRDGARSSRLGGSDGSGGLGHARAGVLLWARSGRACGRSKRRTC
eukprot:Unigene10471_Nuclearia_a/m.32003 Unigene10471_Nuclearia_a/g.32003  ORF Unigene10471_Nuclearia_a/g.32003 Unigene10471_Nuclearia_a/m.32003 type:complete len:513 (+) Unigene10471_Nuclearia_a:554-2092(+)